MYRHKTTQLQLHAMQKDNTHTHKYTHTQDALINLLRLTDYNFHDQQIGLQIPPHTHTYTHTYTHTHTYIHTYTPAYTYTHIHRHTHTCSIQLQRARSSCHDIMKPLADQQQEDKLWCNGKVHFSSRQGV